MIIDCVLSSCNILPLYKDFIPSFIKVWRKILPKADVKIVLISTEIPQELREYTDNIILFEPIDGVSDAFISQYIRNLYPSVLNYNGGILITDIDMVPMNSRYYSDNIKEISGDKFVYYRDVLLRHGQIAMCYNVAVPEVWKSIFNVNTINGIIEHLTKTFKDITYDNTHGGQGWSKDQLDLFKYVMEWNKKTNNFVSLKDSSTGFKRLDRVEFSSITPFIEKNIKNGFYSDYHMHRPYSSNKKLIDTIIELL